MIDGLLYRIASFLGSRRCLGVAASFMVLENLNSWWNIEPQGDANFFCSREDFPAVLGPSGLIITSHQTDCDTIAKESKTYVYLHPQAEADAASNLILRYDGNTPRITWLDTSHIAIRVEKVSLGNVDKLVAIRNGIHVVTNFTDVPSTEAVPQPSPASRD